MHAKEYKRTYVKMNVYIIHKCTPTKVGIITMFVFGIFLPLFWGGGSRRSSPPPLRMGD